MLTGIVLAAALTYGCDWAKGEPAYDVCRDYLIGGGTAQERWASLDDMKASMRASAACNEMLAVARRHGMRLEATAIAKSGQRVTCEAKK